MLTIKSTVISFPSFSLVYSFSFWHPHTYIQPKNSFFDSNQYTIWDEHRILFLCFFVCEKDQNNWIHRKENVNDDKWKRKYKIQHRKNLTTCEFKRTNEKKNDTNELYSVNIYIMNISQIFAIFWGIKKQNAADLQYVSLFLLCNIILISIDSEI